MAAAPQPPPIPETPPTPPPAPPAPPAPTAGRPLETRGRSRIEALLLKRGLVTAFRLEALAGRVAAAKRPLVEVLLEHGVLTEPQLLQAVAEESRMEPMATPDVLPSPDVQRMIPAEIAQRHGILPLRLDADGSLVVVTADPFQIDVIDELRARVGRRIRVLLARRRPCARGSATPVSARRRSTRSSVTRRRAPRRSRSAPPPRPRSSRTTPPRASGWTSSPPRARSYASST